VLVCPDKKRPDENKDKASLGYDEQVGRHSQGLLCPAHVRMQKGRDSCATHILIVADVEPCIAFIWQALLTRW
jgi:hypothetical protein